MLEPHDGDTEAEEKLRERRPTAFNGDELLSMMEVTRPVRRAWITTARPTISEILIRYPRLGDMPQAVRYTVCLCCQTEFSFCMFLFFAVLLSFASCVSVFLLVPVPFFCCGSAELREFMNNMKGQKTQSCMLIC